MYNDVWGCAEILPGITNNSDGSQVELVYNSTEITDELDDSVNENLFELDCESEFEGFVV